MYTHVYSINRLIKQVYTEYTLTAKLISIPKSLNHKMKFLNIPNNFYNESKSILFFFCFVIQ